MKLVVSHSVGTFHKDTTMSSYEERLREASLHMNTTEGRLRELEHKHAGLQSFTSKCSMKEEVSNINALVSGMQVHPPQNQDDRGETM